MRGKEFFYHILFFFFGIYFAVLGLRSLLWHTGYLAVA